MGWGWVDREEFRRYVGTVGQWAGWGGAGVVGRNLEAMLGLVLLVVCAVDVVGAAKRRKDLNEFSVGLERELLSRQVDEVAPLGPVHHQPPHALHLLTDRQTNTQTHTHEQTHNNMNDNRHKYNA